jgi:hypothetical protein
VFGWVLSGLPAGSALSSTVASDTEISVWSRDIEEL